jgi:hypothetical protein
MEGHREFFNDQLFSIFSASDYGGRNVRARILEIDLDADWDSNWKHLEIMKDLEI